MFQNGFISFMLYPGLEFGKFKTYQTLYKGYILYCSAKAYITYIS